ncbi:MAG: TauD/TfdA family dioxygenase [Microthrixaceae bacterium]|nr:TauD/TfdA family dioxygenase [Microthrixaceae bacterium]
MFQSVVRHRPVSIVEIGNWDAPSPPNDAPGTAAFLSGAGYAGATLPTAAHHALVDLADGLHNGLPGVGAVVLRGLPVGTVPPTPDRPTAPVAKDHVSELTLLTAARILGQPVGYLPEHGGDIVQNICPAAADASRQTSTSSRVTLAFHTETAFHPHRPRFLLLLCLRGDDAAHTTLCSIDDILPAMSAETRTILGEPRFHTRADESFGGGSHSSFLEPMRVLSGDPDHPTLVFDEELTEGIDDPAREALAELAAAISAHHTSVVLQQGDLLAVDNHRCVHGRSPFVARFDGTDRWLQRTFVVSDLSPSAGERVGRIINTTFAA